MPARNKADPEWDRHKPTIKSLYMEDNLKLQGPGGVIDTMIRSHSFIKSKSQYESKFRTWGFRKYGNKDDWKTIGRKLAGRNRAGKESVVCINGEIIPKSKVERQIRRHAFTTAFERNLPSPSPRTPEGFEVRTPAAEVAAEVDSEDIESFTGLDADARSLAGWIDMDRSPIFQLQNRSPSLQAERRTNDLWPAQSDNVTCVSPPTGTSRLPFASREDELHFFGNWILDLPFLELEAHLSAQATNPLIPTIAQRPGSDFTMETIWLPEDQQHIPHQVVSIHHALFRDVVPSTKILKAMLPSAARVNQVEDQLILTSNHHRSDSAPSKLLTLFIFAMANNFAGLDSVPIDEFMDYLKRQTNTQLLRHVLSTSGPESEAFAEKLFSAAVKSEDALIVEILLQKGLDPNDLVCVHNGEKFTPLEYSSMMWNVDITRLLLNANSDVNKSWSRDLAEPRGAIGCAIASTSWWGRKRTHGPVLLELVQMLFGAGGNVDLEHLDFSHLHANQELLDLLVENLSKIKSCDLSHIMEGECDNATVTRTITKLLNVGIDPGRCLGMAVDMAVERTKLELVQLLVRSRVPLTRNVPVCAIRSRYKKLVRFPLDTGVDVDTVDEAATADVVDYQSSSEIRRVSTPLSEVISWGDAEIISLLEEKGAWSQTIGEVRTRRDFGPALISASASGQLTIIQKLLKFRPLDVYGKDLRDALVAAICAEEEAIILTLLDAGADVDRGCYHGPLNINAGDYAGFSESSSPLRGPALIEALLQKNEKLVRLLLDAHVVVDCFAYENRQLSALAAAVKWGNLSIVQEMVRLGATMDEAALEIAVNRKDFECAQILLDVGAADYMRAAEYKRAALVAAVTNSDIEMVDWLLSNGADPANPQALVAAVTSSNIEMVDCLFSNGADPANSEALLQALPQGLPMIQKLLAAFATIYPHGRPMYGFGTFERAIQEGNIGLIDLLLHAKIDVKNRFERVDFENPCAEYTLLGVTILAKHAASLAILQKLVVRIGNPNIVVQRAIGGTDHRETALLVAIRTKDIQKVQLLIDAGADVNWPATRGVKRTPVQKAAEIGSYEITQLLIGKGALVNDEPAWWGGATALQLAAIGGYIGIAELLLNNGADVNAPPAKVYGRTALEGAAEHGRIDMLKLLWNAGAKFNGAEFERALQLAKDNGYMAARRYLETLWFPCEEPSMDH